MGFFGKLLGKKQEDSDPFGNSESSKDSDPFGNNDDSFGDSKNSDPFGSNDSFSDTNQSQSDPSRGLGLPKSRSEIGLTPEPVDFSQNNNSPLDSIHNPQPVPRQEFRQQQQPQQYYPQNSDNSIISKDIEVMSSKIDALRSNVESVSIKLDHLENLIRNLAEMNKQRW